MKKKIALIGSGFVGKAAGKGFIAKGNEVVFYDIKTETIKELRTLGYKAEHIEDICKRNDFDFLMISVPTPTIDGVVCLDALKKALKELGKYLRHAKKYPIFVIRSTVLPGTTEEIAIPILEANSQKKYLSNFGVAMNPEFLREATAVQDFANPRVTVIGANDLETSEKLDKLYKPFGATIVHMAIMEAEMMKYAHNLLNATKISFFNEFRILNDELGLNADLQFKTIIKSAEAMWNPEYGTKNLGAYGGSCLPKDTVGFFTWSTQKFGRELPVLKGTIETNEYIKKIQSNKKRPYRKVLDLFQAKKITLNT